MWHKLLYSVSFVWSKLWSPLIAASLVAGFAYLLKLREEKRELRKRLSVQLYIPVRQQLSEAQPAIRKFQRALSINIETWKTALATGVTNELKPPLRKELAELYESTLPKYDEAWKVLNMEIAQLRKEWDSRFADVQNSRALGARAAMHAREEPKIITIDWWLFLIGDTPVIQIDGLRDGDVLRIFDGFMTPERFKLLDQSVEQFLIQRWKEASINPAMQQYRDFCQRALSEIPKAIAFLGRETLY